MSLQQAAKYLQSKGRGEDSVLVHMTPGEVKSLQAVAMAHGGSLSLNPETGLPEAGFLSNLMPMIVGAGLMAATGGAAAPAVLGGMSMPAAIGLGVGGLETLRTGNLNKGIMAGLGAYGGAGLAGGLAASAQTTVPGMAEAAAAGDPTAAANAIGGMDRITSGVQGLGTEAGRGAFMQGVGGGTGLAKFGLAAAAPTLLEQDQGMPAMQKGGPNPYKYQFNANPTTPTPMPDVPGYGYQGQNFGREQRFFNPVYTPMPAMAGGGPVEMMSNANAVGANTGYPMADIARGAYATPYQQPISQNVLSGAQDTRVDPYTGQERLAGGGLSHLGDYSDGGRLLRGPGDGVSDSIPAVIGNKQPARLADGEFVVPARIVSELGNGSTEAGARKLYAMMDRVQKARGKTVGKGKVATNSRADKHLPA